MSGQASESLPATTTHRRTDALQVASHTKLVQAYTSLELLLRGRIRMLPWLQLRPCRAWALETTTCMMHQAQAYHPVMASAVETSRRQPLATEHRRDRNLDRWQNLAYLQSHRLQHPHLLLLFLMHQPVWQARSRQVWNPDMDHFSQLTCQN